MSEIVYLMGKDKPTNKYFKTAKAYFDDVFKAAKDKASKVVIPREFTLDAVLSDLAKRTTTFDVVHVVTHASPLGRLFFGLSSDKGYREEILEADLQLALDTWDTVGHGRWKPLWAR